MPGKLQDRVCLITGSTGIAACTAKLAAREGATVFVASNAEDSCPALAESLGAQGGVCDACVADLTVESSAAKVVAQCVARFGRIDALFNVAGISGRSFGDGPVHQCTERGWDMTMDTNVKSMFLVSRAVIGRMLQRPVQENGERGSILNMASVLAFSPEPAFFSTHAYAASNLGLELYNSSQAGGRDAFGRGDAAITLRRQIAAAQLALEGNSAPTSYKLSF